MIDAPIDIFSYLPESEPFMNLRWVDSPMQLPRLAGTYLLLLELTNMTNIQVGKLGKFRFPDGYYFYTGSALGAGGLASRIGRHWRVDESKRLRWHIDYLRTNMQLLGSWVLIDDTPHLECQLAQALANHAQIKTLKNVGSSDCDCVGHTFFIAQ